MARYARALLPLLLLACALVRSSHCSRSPPPGEPQKPGRVVVPSHSPVAHGGADDDEPRGGETATTGQVRLVEKEAAGANAGYGAAASSAFGNGGVGSEQRGAAALLVQQRAPLRRMMLSSSGRVQGGDAEDSAAAGASCRSNSAHITCAPPAH